MSARSGPSPIRTRLELDQRRSSRWGNGWACEARRKARPVANPLAPKQKGGLSGEAWAEGRKETIFARMGRSPAELFG